jgi:hypothetical protein
LRMVFRRAPDVDTSRKRLKQGIRGGGFVAMSSWRALASTGDLPRCSEVYDMLRLLAICS